MIDTSKYEGHTPGPWVMFKSALWRKWMDGTGDLELMFEFEPLPLEDEIDPQLMADAPLLLEEVKRLREVAYRKDMQVGERDREVKRLREAIVGMIDSIDNRYIRDVQHAAGCLRDLIGYYDEEE